LPFFQLSQCQTAIQQTLANMANAFPATAFSILQNFALLPIRILLGGGTGADSGQFT
jgi:hypothetical protein